MDKLIITIILAFILNGMSAQTMWVPPQDITGFSSISVEIRGKNWSTVGSNIESLCYRYFMDNTLKEDFRNRLNTDGIPLIADENNSLYLDIHALGLKNDLWWYDVMDIQSSDEGHFLYLSWGSNYKVIKVDDTLYDMAQAIFGETMVTQSSHLDHILSRMIANMSIPMRMSEDHITWELNPEAWEY